MEKNILNTNLDRYLFESIIKIIKKGKIKRPCLDSSWVNPGSDID